MNIEQLLKRYANLHCTKEEIHCVHNYIKENFSRCFEVIRLMKARAYNELLPASPPEADICSPQRSFMEPKKRKMIVVPPMEESEAMGGSFDFLSEEDEEGKMRRKYDDIYGVRFVQHKKEELSALDLKPEGKSFTATCFLDMLKTYVDQPD